MSRINCHSGFKHYEMFHNMGGDVINIGSNNTTIFNMGTGFGGGSFWSGLGYGLGNGLGSIFGGLFGGGMGNMGGFGNFGFGGFGMSPFSNMFMTPFGGISGFNMLERSTKSKDSEDGKGKVKDDSISNKNIDYAKLNKLFERKNNLLEAKDPKLTDLEKLKNDIDKLAKDLDGNDDGNDNDYIKQLKRGLDDKISELKGKEPANKPETKVDGADNKGKVAPADKTGNVKDDAAVGSTKFDDKLKEAGNDRKKLLALINDSSLTPEERAKAKAKYAETFGYTNYDGKDTINKDNMKLVTDTGLGSKADITTYVDVKQEAGSHPTEITMQTKYSKTKVTYKYVGVVDGEYIYESQSGKGQQYALQKNSNGGYALVEYAYHKGYKEPDVI